MEDNNSPMSTSSTVWLNLSGSIIPPHRNITIYMVFLPEDATWSQNWGEAPQLSTNYGEFDNGYEVFPIYVDGNTPLADFSTYPGVYISQNTGVAFDGHSINVLYISGYNDHNGQITVQVAYKGSTTQTSVIAESLFQMQTLTTSMGPVVLANSNSPTPSTNAIDVESGDHLGSYFSQAYTLNGTAERDINLQGSSNTNWNYASVTTISGSAYFYGYISPSLYQPQEGFSGTVNVNPLSHATSLYLAFGIVSTSSNHLWDLYVNWERARTYPPAGVMPSVAMTGGGIGIPQDTFYINEFGLLLATVVVLSTIIAVWKREN